MRITYYRENMQEKSGDNSEEVTPVPIPNTEVKLSSAEDTWWEAAWEIRTSPVFSCLKGSLSNGVGEGSKC